MNLGKKNTAAVAVALSLAFTLAAGVATVFAVHDEDFELEGNIINDPGGDQTVDWADLFDVSGTDVPTTKQTLPTGFGRAFFFRDFNPTSNEDDTTFTTGSKDIQNISGGGDVSGEWQCARSNNVSDKTDLLNAYATVFVDPDTSEVKLYFGMEVASNEGTRSAGFWFLKDNTVQCTVGPNGPGTTTFTGNHQNGDVFVATEWTKGGGVSTIQVFEWQGDAATGSLVNKGTGVDCKVASAGDDVCATVNSGDILFFNQGEVPWLTKTKPSQSAGTTSADLDEGMFFEGAISLTDLHLEACFSKFLVNTRTSAETSSTIFDYVLGEFSVCEIEVNKLCSVPAPGEANPVVDDDGESIITTFDVTIKNTGIGKVFDVTLEEDATLGAGESCAITAITGAVNPPDTTTPIDLTAGDAVQVSDELAKGATVTVTVECDTFDNPFRNSVTSRAGSSDLLQLPDLVSSDIMAEDDPTTPENESELCPVEVSPMLDVTKACKAVRLVSSNGGLDIQVEVDVTVENTDPDGEKLVNVVVENEDNDPAGEPLPPNDDDIPLTAVDNLTDRNPVTFDNTLDPGEKAFFISIYEPKRADNSDETDPNKATFTDRVDAEATGALSGDTTHDFSSVSPTACGCPPPAPTPTPTPTTLRSTSLQPTASGESARTEAAAPGTHTLKVNNGRGSGRYAAGDVVKVTAHTPPPGKKFAGWSGDTQILANPFVSPTTAIIPSSTDVTVSAIFKDVSQ